MKQKQTTFEAMQELQKAFNELGSVIWTEIEPYIEKLLKWMFKK